MTELNSHTTKSTPPRARTNVPVFAKLVASYKLWQQYFDSLPKSKRRTIGEKIDHLYVELIEAVSLAGLSPQQEKAPYLKRAVTKMDCLKIFLQVAWEIDVLENKRYIALSSTLTEPGKMIGGWNKQVTQKLPS